MVILDVERRGMPPGVLIRDARVRANDELVEWLHQLGLGSVTQIHRTGCGEIHLSLLPDAARDVLPGHDTLQLRRSGLFSDDVDEAQAGTREILVAMLAGPIVFVYPGVAELLSAVSIRRAIVETAAATRIAFDTESAERPARYFEYDEERGFLLRDASCLREALSVATRPDVSGERYSFSCYRATEYVLLLSIAMELARCNPELLERLSSQWRKRAIVSGEFHDVFLFEYGSIEQPLPLRYYIPGDRVWFRNPDARSADIPGYEGSWVFYLGNGLFSNFWHDDRPYTLERKCLEIHHWRDGVRQRNGVFFMDEDVVESLVNRSAADPEISASVLSGMLQPRAPRGVYGEGGCLDVSRECARYVCPETADIRLPVA